MGPLDTAVLVDTMPAATKAASAYAIAGLECVSWSDRIHHRARLALSAVAALERTGGLARLQAIENERSRMGNEALRCESNPRRGSDNRRAQDETAAPMRWLSIVAF